MSPQEELQHLGSSDTARNIGRRVASRSTRLHTFFGFQNALRRTIQHRFNQVQGYTKRQGKRQQYKAELPKHLHHRIDAMIARNMAALLWSKKSKNPTHKICEWQTCPHPQANRRPHIQVGDAYRPCHPPRSTIHKYWRRMPRSRGCILRRARILVRQFLVTKNQKCNRIRDYPHEPARVHSRDTPTSSCHHNHGRDNTPTIDYREISRRSPKSRKSFDPNRQ